MGKNKLQFDPIHFTYKCLISASGAGDHGHAGIQTFERDHSCGPVCQELGLDPDSRLEDMNFGEEDSHGSGGRRRSGRAATFDPIRDV